MIEKGNPEDHVCKNCGNSHTGNYCNNCGQKVISNRYTIKHLINIVFLSFDLNKGVFFTAKMLFISPGKVINDYLDGKTKSYYNPISYLLIIASIYAILMVGFNLLDSNISSMNEAMGLEENKSPLQQTINNFVKKYLSFISIIILPFYSLASKWIFKKFKRNYAEHLIMNSFAIAQYLLIFVFLIFIIVFFPSIVKFMMIFGAVILFSYYTYYARDIYKISWLRSAISSIGTIILGILMFYLLLTIVSIIVFTVLKIMGVDLQQYIR